MSFKTLKHSKFKGSVEQYLKVVCELPYEPLYYEIDRYKTYSSVREMISEATRTIRIQCKDGVVYHPIAKKGIVFEHSVDFGYYKRNKDKLWTMFSQYDEDDNDIDLFEDEELDEDVDNKFIEQE